MYVAQKFDPYSMHLINSDNEQGSVWVQIRTADNIVAIGAIYLKVTDGVKPNERVDNIAYNDEIWERTTAKITECYRNNKV